MTCPLQIAADNLDSACERQKLVDEIRRGETAAVQLEQHFARKNQLLADVTAEFERLKARYCQDCENQRDVDKLTAEFEAEAAANLRRYEDYDERTRAEYERLTLTYQIGVLANLELKGASDG